MAGNWTHNEPYYRCGFRSEYAGATGKHPRWVYLRERYVTPQLDEWIEHLFDPENLEVTIAAMAAAQAPDDAAAARDEAARKRILDCGKKLAKYRAALEAGTDPSVVAGWVREVEAERLAAQRETRRDDRDRAPDRGRGPVAGQEGLGGPGRPEQGLTGPEHHVPDPRTQAHLPPRDRQARH